MKGANAIVRDSFARAAQQYDTHADFQRDAGRRLAEMCAALNAPARMLDAGCGTGHGLALLEQRWPSSARIALDFAAPMLRHVRASAAAVCADIEALPLSHASMDLVWSNLALQWCDLDRAVHEFARVLRSGGYVAATTLGPQTFKELQQAFAGVDAFRHTNDFIDEQRLRTAFANAGLSIVELCRKAIACHYPDLSSLLASVRELGANRVMADQRRRGLMGKSAWHRFADNYARMQQAEGLPLTYDTFFVLARKP